jgi:hypothetical protein
MDRQLRAGPVDGASERDREVHGVGLVARLFWQNTAVCGKIRSHIGCQMCAGIFNGLKNGS